MPFRSHFEVSISERAFLLVDEVPVAFLGPGRVTRWTFGHTARVVRYALADSPAARLRRASLRWPRAGSLRSPRSRNLVVALPPELRALVPEGELQRVVVQPHERAVVTRREQPVRVLEPGEHDVWTHGGVRVAVVDVSGTSCPPLREPLRALLSGCGYVDVTVPAGAVGLRFVDGAIDAELAPGRHAAWTALRDVTFVVIDMRERILAITGQEVMTRDKVSLRMNASVTFRVADARRLATAAKDADAALYLGAQLLLRDVVAAHTLEELLAQRELLAERCLAVLVARGAELGLAVVALGVKDLVLPGEMRTLLNRVIEAQKAAEANVITRREETAAARSLAQTAKVLAESPLLVRLKELEAYKELAAKVGTLHVVMGDSALGKLTLKA